MVEIKQENGRHIVLLRMNRKCHHGEPLTVFSYGRYLARYYITISGLNIIRTKIC